MNRFWGIIFLPLVWMALTGNFSGGNFILGLLLSSLALWVAHPVGEGVPLIHYVRKGRRWLSFVLFFLQELI